MKPPENPPDESWEEDALWTLLDQSPPSSASGRFVDDSVRAARLAGQPSSWWSPILSPTPKRAGLTAIAAAVALAFTLFQAYSPGPSPAPSSHPENAAQIQEIADTETLIAAVDHLDDFSDTELVTLIGF